MGTDSASRCSQQRSSHRSGQFSVWDFYVQTLVIKLIFRWACSRGIIAGNANANLTTTPSVYTRCCFGCLYKFRATSYPKYVSLSTVSGCFRHIRPTYYYFVCQKVEQPFRPNRSCPGLPRQADKSLWNKAEMEEKRRLRKDDNHKNLHAPPIEESGSPVKVINSANRS